MSIKSLVSSLIKATPSAVQSTLKVPVQYQYHLLDEKTGPNLECMISREEALQYYADMMEIRRMETVISTLYTQKLVRGFCHLYNGQEAIAVGLYHRMRPQDTLITSYRAHAYLYLMGGHNPEPVIGELLGLDCGCSKGKGGSMHVYNDRFYGGNGIVGAQIPLGTGIALAHKYNDTKGISFTIYGDGTANQGQVYESYNMAKLWNLPVIYVIENNMYAMGTSAIRGTANPNYYQLCSFIPGLMIDGMDIFATRNAVDFAIDFITGGKGPIILEMRTYRYFGHSMSDPGSSYRTREEVKEVRQKRDPVKMFKKIILDAKLASQEELDKIKQETNKNIATMVEKVKTHKELDVEQHIAGDVVKKCLQEEIRGVTMYKPLKHRNHPPPK